MVGIVGNKSSGKTSTALKLMLDMRQANPDKPKMYVLGVEPQLKQLLAKNKIYMIESKEDILHMKSYLRDSLIFIAEFGILFDGANKSREGKKINRFLDRIEHRNSKLMIDTARQGFYNKAISGHITACLVKETDYANLVNGSWINDAVRSIPSVDDHRVVCEKGEAYLVSNKDEATQHITIDYDKRIDTKKGNTTLWDNLENNTEKVTKKHTQQHTKKITQKNTTEVNTHG